MWMILALSLLGAPPDVQVSTLAGGKAMGALVALTPEGVVVRTASGDERWGSVDLLAIKNKSPLVIADKTSPAVWIELVDGSQLLGTHYTAAAGLARVQLVGGESLDIPTRSIRTVRFQSHDTELAKQSRLAKQWQDILATEPTGDVIIVRKVAMSEDEGEAAKSASAALDELGGVIGDVSDDKIQFTYDDQQIPVARTKVEGIVYFHPSGRELPDPLCRLDDVSGSRWNLKSVVLAGETLQLVSTAGVKAELPLRRMQQVDYSGGKIVYLSDLEPETSEWTNYFGATAASPSLAKLYAPRRDRSFDGGPIIVAGQTYEKGLAIHSRTLLEYRLQGKFSKFAALAALEDKARSAGNVKLAISLDGKLLGEYVLGGKHIESIAIAHDIQNGRKLSILVDFGDGLDVSDRLHLANARVTK